MLYSIRQKLKKQWFNVMCRGILSTPPIKPRESHLTIVTMVCHADLIMYLISIKSFYSYFGRGKIVVLNDGTLNSKDMELIRYHISPSKIISANDMKSDNCPQYISWKRLLYISDCVMENYVIQLDSDTLTTNHIPEAINCVRQNRSFILGTWKNQEIEPIRERLKKVKSSNSEHVQIVAEKEFDKLPNYMHLKYVRGCAAFTGFAKGSFSRSIVEQFSEQMQKIIGLKWSNWGSEQTTSNYIIANSPNAMVLPYPKFAGFRLKAHEKNSFLHFSGTHRFKEGVYIKMARDFIKKIKTQSAESF